MRCRFLCLLFGTILALQTQIQAQATEPQSSVWIDRIRAGLKRPASLLIAVPSTGRPTFRSEVRARPFDLQFNDDRAIDPTMGMPSVGQLVMEGIENVRSAAVQYKRRRAERRARKEVADTLAAFCALRKCSTTEVGK
jgi:hypothetical protein